jgi:hypothetical protein
MVTTVLGWQSKVFAPICVLHPVRLVMVGYTETVKRDRKESNVSVIIERVE